MARVLVTGATGFIGSHVARLALERGDDVRLAIEDGSPDTAIADLDCERLRCDIRDRRSVRRVLKGNERVFHCAGLTSVRRQDRERLFEVNVGGTKVVMEECLRAGVERVIYTSSAAVVGPAEEGKTADEGQLFTAGHLDIPYVNSVHEAELEAMRVAAQGLPLVCVNPAVCFGAGDVQLASTRLVRSFLLDEWLPDREPPKLRATTYANYQTQIRTHVVPGLGSVELQRLSPAQLNGFYRYDD